MSFQLLVDIHPCNLSCRMCPRGGVHGFKNSSKGSMSLDFFKRIIDKFIEEECAINGLFFGNWGEPCLNPELPEMIEYAKKIEPKSIVINTNLTKIHDPEKLLKSNPSIINASLSGFTQDVYCRNHKGGKVKKVLKNLVTLAEMRTTKSPLLRISFHRYIYNRKDEELIKEFCQKHDINFCLRKPYICSVEENVKFHADKKMAQFYRKFIDLDAEVRKMRTINPDECGIKRTQIAVNIDGMLYRCCGVFDEKNLMGNFFDHKIEEIPHIKSKICEICAKTPMSWR